MMSFFFNNGSWFEDKVESWCLFDLIMERKPRSFLEIKCGAGFLLSKVKKRLDIDAWGIETNSITNKTFRISNDINYFNFYEEKWPFEDKQFDMGFNIFLTETYKKEHEHIVNEIERVCKRSLCITENRPSETVGNKEFLNYKENIFKIPIFPPKTDYFEKINIFSNNNLLFNWHNINCFSKNLDGYNSITSADESYLKENFKKNSVIAIKSDNLLDYLCKKEIDFYLHILKEKMIPGSAIRLSYLNYNKFFYFIKNNNIPIKEFDFLLKDKKNLWKSKKEIYNALKKNGFCNIKFYSFDCSDYACFQNENIDIYPDFYDFVECRKMVF